MLTKSYIQSCLLYTLAMSIFVEKIRSDILTGTCLCYIIYTSCCLSPYSKLTPKTGLFCVDGFLRKLWCFICELGPSGGLYLFERILVTCCQNRIMFYSAENASFFRLKLEFDTSNRTDTNTPAMLEANEPYLAVLSLFCQCASLLLSIADDEEFFERQHPFTIEGFRRVIFFSSSS